MNKSQAGGESDHPGFCEWRISVTECSDAAFFQSAYIVSASLQGLNISCLLFLFSYRIFVRRDDLNSFKYGANGALLGVLGNAIVDFAYRIIVLTSTNRILLEVIWGLSLSSIILPAGLYISTFVEGLPLSLVHGSSAARLKSLLPLRRTRFALFYSFFTYLTLTLCLLYGLSGHYHALGEHQREDRFFQAAVGIQTVNFLVFFAVYIVLANSFRLFLRDAMEISSDPSLPMNYKKIFTNTTVMALNILVYTIASALIGFMPSFYERYALSRSIGIIYIMIMSLGFFVAVIGIVYVDVRKHLEMKKEKDLERPSSGPPRQPAGV